MKANRSRLIQIFHVDHTNCDCVIFILCVGYQLAKAYEELNKRIYEHDKCMAEGTMKPDVTLEVNTGEECLQQIPIDM